MKKMASYLFAVLTVLAVASAGETTSAKGAICGDAATPSYTGITSLGVDIYDVYVRLGGPGQSAAVDGYVQSSQLGDECVTIGRIEASGDEWRKLGLYRITGGNGEITLQLSSAALSGLPDANRPSFLLISHARPACVPRAECETQVGGQKAFIRPSSNNLAENSLRIVIAKDVTTDHVDRVLYYVNNELMYQTKKLEPFDMQAVPYYGTTMTRVIEYSSGQTAVLQSDVPADHIDDLGSMLARTVKKYANTLLLGAVIVGGLVIVRLIRALVYYQRKRYYWRLWHGFIKEKVPVHHRIRQIQWGRYRRLAKHIYFGIEIVAAVGLVVGGLVLLITAYIGQIAVVRGDSMVAAYQNNQSVVVNKLPITFARINHTMFIPKRGEVVVARPSYGASLDMAEVRGETIVKRVIGLPGDKVVVRSGVITIFNTEYPDGFKPEVTATWASFIQPGGFTDEVTIRLNEREVFLVGDNRPVSIDSRLNGPVDVNQLIGVVIE
ncbi:MAG: signal peptidase I [Candidatus Saccharimonas sp.]